MNEYDNSYDKYLSEHDQFLYDENGKKGSFLKQDSELFNEESYVPGRCIRVKRLVSTASPIEDWQVLIDNKEHMILKGTRFTSAEREFLRTTQGVVFIIDGIKSNWKSISEFKKQLKGKVQEKE